ncbi:MAG: bacteriohemerythrin [Terasakiella sp.]|uniref:bacteriohemerythrin n=1 Tax=unclassified Terasakiella TaxID=2614952 RepID=UPI003AFF989F
MKSIQWDIEKFSVGDKTLDNQHQKIVAMINNLINESDLDIHSETLHDTLAEMLKYSKDHLDYEEALLKKIGYERLEDHAQLHWEYLEMVSDLSMDTVTGNKNVPSELITYLTHWLNDHILVEDMKYKPYMEKLSN